MKSTAQSTPKYMWLSFFGIYFLVCAAVLPVIAGGISVISYFAIILVCMVLGYFLQAGVCAAFKFKRELESRAYEPEYKYFKRSLALPVWVIAAALAVPVHLLVDRILYLRAKLPTYSYDPDSLIPITVALVFFMTVALGSFVWFFPYSRLMTGGGLYTGLTVIFILFILHASIQSPGLTVVGVCLLGYAFFAMIAGNQYALGRTYRGTVVSFMTPQTRKYNLLLSLALVAVFFGLLFFAYLIVNGIRTTILFIIAAILRAMNNNDAGYTEEEEQDIFKSVSAFVFGNAQASHSINYWCYILFVVFLVIALIITLTGRRPELRRFIAWLKTMIVALFEFLWLPIRDYAQRSDEAFTNYVDEEVKLQKDDIKVKIRESAGTGMTWRDFNVALRSKPTAEEKYRFAYSTYVGQLRKMPLFVRRSDTPRKICERLTVGGKLMSASEIEQVTEAFEQIEFADRPADRKTDEAMATLCEKIKENM
ncbi:MAG: hypothetical protein ACI3XI_02940 [Eubacteriales bacterium]